LFTKPFFLKEYSHTYYGKEWYELEVYDLIFSTAFMVNNDFPIGKVAPWKIEEIIKKNRHVQKKGNTG
jgi:hypothetical protein